MKEYQKDMKPSIGDVLLSSAKGAISAIPFAGGFIAEFMGYIQSPLSRRKDRWFEQIITEIERLKERVDSFSPEKLAENEQFITTFLQATQIALRNHQKEKIDALKNAVLHSVQNTQELDHSMQMIFLRLVDIMTPTHIQFLKFLQHPEEWMMEHGITRGPIIRGSTIIVFERVFPGLAQNHILFSLIKQDLQTYGLANVDILNAGTLELGVYQKRTTLTGDMFLEYISDM